MKVKKRFYFIGFLAVSTVVMLWMSGLFGLWSDGMAFLANDTKRFTDKNGHLIEGSYSLKVDLSDLDTNVGKEIYNEEDHRIYVSSLQRSRNGGYEIGFRSSGPYSLSRASLVSGIHHEAIDDNAFTMIPTAKMSVEYNGKTYHADQTGQCGLNYKNGDCFYFSFFLGDEPDREPVDHTGEVELTMTDLYDNIWMKRD